MINNIETITDILLLIVKMNPEILDTDANESENILEKMSKYYEHNTKHPANEIASFIIDNNNNDELEFLDKKFEILISKCKELELVGKLQHLYDHIELEQTRMYLIDTVEESLRNRMDEQLAYALENTKDNLKQIRLANKNEIAKTVKKIQKNNFEQLKTLKEEILQVKIKNEEKIESKVEAMNAQMVSILGIFTAIAFTMFGGLTMINSIVQTMGNDLGFLKASSLSLIIGLVMFNIAYLLLNTVSKLAGKDIARETTETRVILREIKKHPIWVCFNGGFGLLVFVLIGLYAIEWLLILFR